MNTCKKIISTICASVFAFSCFGFNASAKVIEPEIVKTETWTTSYFIDDDMDTLYPYIQCEADIYNDGTIKLYMWNTHEWDGFATVSHKATLIEIPPIMEDSVKFNVLNAYCNNSHYVSQNCDIYFHGFSFYTGSNKSWSTDETFFNTDRYDLIRLNYYSNSYRASEQPHDFRSSTVSIIHKNYTAGTHIYSNYELREFFTLSGYIGYLPSMEVNNKRLCYVFSPMEDPIGTYNFRLYGHDITITPELLSGNIVAEPELTEQEKYIKQLEEENSKLKTEIESYKKLDFDGDGLLTNADAQMILVYYTDSLVGKTTGKVEDYSEYVKQISG
jgi:hypothetical protein